MTSGRGSAVEAGSVLTDETVSRVRRAILTEVWRLRILMRHGAIGKCAQLAAERVGAVAAMGLGMTVAFNFARRALAIDLGGTL